MNVPFRLIRHFAVAVVVLSLVIGCRGGKAKVSGKVTYQGTGLPGGKITFQPVSGKGNPGIGNIDENGNYSVEIPAGEVYISIDNRGLEKPDPGPVGAGDADPTGKDRSKGGRPKDGMPRDAMAKATKDKNIKTPVSKTPVGKYVKIPDKYYTAEKSGLKETFKAGSHTHPIELKD